MHALLKLGLLKAVNKLYVIDIDYIKDVIYLLFDNLEKNECMLC